MRIASLTSAVAFGLLLFTSGCDAEECRQMKMCCTQLVDQEWVGSSCGELASGVTDPQTCRTITRTLQDGLKERGAEIPTACK